MYKENMFLKKFRRLLLMFLSLETAVLILISGFPLVSFSQVVSEISTSYYKTADYIAKVDTIVNIKLNVNSEFEQFEVKGSDFYYDIRPNITLSTKISFSYKFISLGIGFKPKFIPGNNDNDLQGKTRTLSFGLNIMTKHLMQELNFGFVTGFYLHNTADYPPISDWTKGEDPYIQFPDLKVALLRGSTGYKFNENFSLKSISSKTEIQLKSCGSFMPFVTYDYFEIDNKSKDTAQTTSQKSYNLDLVGSIGYMYTLVLKSKFYISAGLIPGFGLQHTKLLTRLQEEDVTTKMNDPVFRMHEKLGIGYNTRRIFTGAELSMVQSTHKQGNTSVQDKAKRTYFQVFVGYRFNAPKILKRETDAVKTLAPTPIQKLLK